MNKDDEIRVAKNKDGSVLQGENLIVYSKTNTKKPIFKLKRKTSQSDGSLFYLFEKLPENFGIEDTFYFEMAFERIKEMARDFQVSLLDAREIKEKTEIKIKQLLKKGWNLKKKDISLEIFDYTTDKSYKLVIGVGKSK